jgi:hypothetical protein
MTLMSDDDNNHDAECFPMAATGALLGEVGLALGPLANGRAGKSDW